MPVSKKQQACVNRYVSGHYDKITLTVPKGERDKIQAYVTARGESVNGFIRRAISETMERDAASAQSRREAGSAGIIGSEGTKDNV